MYRKMNSWPLNIRSLATHIPLILVTSAIIIIPISMNAVASINNNRSVAYIRDVQPEPRRSVQDPKLPSMPDLAVGVQVDRELKAGETHSYVVKLSSGQYLHVVVEQRGIDVVVRLFGPGGQKLTEVNSPNETQGAEPLSFVAE